MKYLNIKNFETKNPLANFLFIEKSCTILIISGFCFVLNPDVIGIVHGFLISQNLARGFLVSKFFPVQILQKSHY
jgi:hypothetical protein